MNQEQKLAVKCAYLDLIGALQAKDEGDYNIHDWKAHQQSINDLEKAFPDIFKAEIENHVYEGDKHIGSFKFNTEGL
jgi:hypothetical protein